MKLNGVVTSLSFLLLLVSCLFTFFTILGGARTKGVLRHFYWLEADTHGFNQAPGNTRWYNYRWCEWEDKHPVGCSIKKTPTAFSPKDNFGGENSEMPNTFIKKRNTYYHMSRAAWVFLLLGLIAMLVAILPQIVSIFTERAHAISATPLWLAFFFITLSACLYTATYVKARKAFHRRGRHAKLGRRNFAFIWISAALLLLNCWWSTFAAAFRAFTNYRSRKSETYYDPASDRSLDNSTAVHSGIGSAPGKKAYFDKNGKAYNGEVLVNGNDASSFERRFDNSAAYGAYNTDNTTGNPAHYKVADSTHPTTTKNVKPTTTKDYKPSTYDSYSGNNGTHATQAPQTTSYAPQGSNYQTQPTQPTTTTKSPNSKTYYPETSNTGNYEDGAYYGNVHKGKTLNPTEYQTNPSSSGYDKPTINSTEYNANRANNSRDYTNPKDIVTSAAQTATNAVRNL